MQIEKNSKLFQKTLDKEDFYAIILKCIIFAFFLWGFFALFSGKSVEKAQKIIACLAVFAQSYAECAAAEPSLAISEFVKFQEWSDSIYDA